MHILKQVPGAACVYAITHEPSRRTYVGITGNLSKRRSNHIARLKRGTHPVLRMQADFDQNGIEAFVLTIVAHEVTWERELSCIRGVPRELRYNVTPNPDLDEEAYVKQAIVEQRQAKGMSDESLSYLVSQYEAHQAWSRNAWAPSARRLVGARWWLKGGPSSDLDNPSSRTPYGARVPPPVWLAGVWLARPTDARP
jgi:hypothetical protein